MPEEIARITVGDLKQWAYCPRVAFYHRMMPGCGARTYKMDAGAKAQQWLEPKELRRSLSRYGFREGRRRNGVNLFDPALGLAGTVDWLIEDGTRAAVVECKLTAGDPSPNHVVQLAGYALLLERLYGWQVPVCFVHRVPDERLFPIPMGIRERETVWAVIASIRDMLIKESMPEATEVRTKCRDCEFVNFCGDIW